VQVIDMIAVVCDYNAASFTTDVRSKYCAAMHDIASRLASYCADDHLRLPGLS
jgi:hypothetical protein